ncbi:MAG TPA: hypothetical protein PJ982_04385 [Lacipirellulaceae bacterium]|nr:hypothetical protein [Lacipirellulaceae bacterium]
MKSALPAAAVIVGLLLLLVSFSWALLFPPQRSWTEEKSVRMAELGSQGNLLKFELIEAQNNPRMHGGKNAAELQAQYDAVNEEYMKLRAEFDNAAQSPKTAATYLRWSGIAFVVAGAIVVFANREA